MPGIGARPLLAAHPTRVIDARSVDAAQVRQQFEDVLAAVMKGPLPKAARGHLAELQQGFVGEPR